MKEIDPNKPLNTQMTLDEYKQAVRDYLNKTYPNVIDDNEHLMMLKEDYFQEFLDDNLSPQATGAGIISGLL